MKTILLRFAADPDAAIKAMGSRVEHAQHLGVVLDDEPTIDTTAHEPLFDQIDSWRTQARRDRRASMQGQPAPDPDGAGQNWQPTTLQRDITALAAAMRQAGLPPGQP